MTVAGGMTSIGSPGDAKGWAEGGWRIGMVRELTWFGSESLKKGPRCARSSVAAIVALPGSSQIVFCRMHAAQVN